MLRRKIAHPPLVALQTCLLKSVDKLATVSPAVAPAELIAVRLHYWLSTPADELADAVDSNELRSAQHLLGLLNGLHSTAGKEVHHV